MAAPFSKYSCRVTATDLNVVDNDARMVPPVNADVSLSGGAMIFTFVSDGATCFISSSNRFPNPLNFVDPPCARRSHFHEKP